MSAEEKLNQVAGSIKEGFGKKNLKLKELLNK